MYIAMTQEQCTYRCRTFLAMIYMCFSWIYELVGGYTSHVMLGSALVSLAAKLAGAILGGDIPCVIGLVGELDGAGKDLQRLLEKKVMLRLWVKVKSGWSDDDRALRSLGYDER